MKKFLDEKSANREMLKQRLMGVGMIILSLCSILLALSGRTVEDQDCTMLFITIPAGCLLLFSKELIIL